MSRPKTVTLGLSGGVDSSVAAYLLQEQGWNVQAVFMQNWASEDPYCTAQEDLSDARIVCDRLRIPLTTINFAQEYQEQVFRYFLDEYARGRTPNPDILCNQNIKFTAFLEAALKSGASHIATGHYARIEKIDNQYQLLKAKDSHKDQSYFLHRLNQWQLAHSLFPLGNLEKSTVRSLAKTLGLPNHQKKDSTGICFVGERKFTPFLKEYLLAQPGPIQNEEGTVLGQHQGLMFYTIGQRKGLRIGGQSEAHSEPWYVIDKDIKQNVLVVGQGNRHPRLYAQNLIQGPVHWIAGKPPPLPATLQAKIRYGQAEQLCTVYPQHTHFTQPQRAITPGQSVVFYDQDICLGGAVIEK